MHFAYAQCKQRGFAPILVVILIASAVGGYFVYQKFSPLQVYVDLSGFAFTYPKYWHVKTFQNKAVGIILVNEKDQEIFTLYDSPLVNWVGCENFSDTIKKEVPIGNKTSTILLNDNGKVVNTCKALPVKTLFGKEFNMEFRYFNTESQEQAIKVLKSLRGIKD